MTFVIRRTKNGGLSFDELHGGSVFEFDFEVPHFDGINAYGGQQAPNHKSSTNQGNGFIDRNGHLPDMPELPGMGSHVAAGRFRHYFSERAVC